jgi:hypothetical protein
VPATRISKAAIKIIDLPETTFIIPPRFLFSITLNNAIKGPMKRVNP